MPKSKPSYPIFFALRESLPLLDPAAPDQWAIVLTPDTSWMFGIRFSLSIFHTTQRVIDREIVYLSYRDHLDITGKTFRDGGPANEIQTQLFNDAKGFIKAEAVPPFFTLLPSLSGYRALVGSMGTEIATTVLRNLNDMVALSSSTAPPPWVRKVSFSTVFNSAFLQGSEAFFAFRNAAPILNGLEFEELESITTDYKLSFKLPTFTNIHDLEFSFSTTSPFPTRIAVIIGKNGVGKSQTLVRIAKALLGDTKALTDLNGKRPQVSRLIVVPSPGETRNTFPPTPKHSRINYRRLHLSRNRQTKRDPGIGDMLIQLARSPDAIKGVSRWRLFTEAISALQPLEEVFVRRQKNYVHPTQKNAADAAFPITDMLVGKEEERLQRWESIAPQEDCCRFINGRTLPLSSGQSTFIRFAAQSCLHIENGSLLLLDEPETHLHPNLITEFVRLLDKLLEFSGSLAIIATHSAYLVREVPRSQVIVLREGDGRMIEVVTPRLRTLGADIGEISHFVFGDELFGRLLELVRAHIEKHPNGAEELLKSMEEDLSSEAWMNLRRELSIGRPK